MVNSIRNISEEVKIEEHEPENKEKKYKFKVKFS